MKKENKTSKKQKTLEEKVGQIIEESHEEKLSDLWCVFEEELMSDTECPDKKMRRILSAWKENKDLVDDLMITLCGWSVESLLNKAKI